MKLTRANCNETAAGDNVELHQPAHPQITVPLVRFLELSNFHRRREKPLKTKGRIQSNSLKSDAQLTFSKMRNSFASKLRLRLSTNLNSTKTHEMNSTIQSNCQPTQCKVMNVRKSISYCKMKHSK